MVHHVIVWTLKEDTEDKESVKSSIKAGLEALQGRIEGLVSIKVYTEPLPTSNSDLMLDSTFVSFDALKAYSVHPDHVKVADTCVRPFVQIRSCMDYED